MPRSLAVLLTCLVLVASGCSQRVVIRAVEPGSRDIAGIQSLAVLDLVSKSDSSAGRDLANVIVAELDQTGAFDVMERSAVARVLDEQQFVTTAAANIGKVSELGRLLGVDGVVVGEVIAWDAGSKALGKYATVAANLRIVNVQSARVVFSDSMTLTEDKFLGGAQKNVALNEMAGALAEQFVAKIAPHYVDREKTFLSAGGEAEKPNGRGIKFATNGLWDKAREQFELARAAEPSSAGVQNNLAICHEQAGELDQAIAAYELAIRLDPDDENIQQNLAGIRATFRKPDQSAKQALQVQRRSQVTSQPTAVPASQ